jgi:two-component system response regulator DesR
VLEYREREPWIWSVRLLVRAELLGRAARAGPVSGPTDRSEATSAQAAARRERRRLRILVLDDHEVVQWGLRLMLARLSWVERCLSASTSSEALAISRRYEPHVALVDLFLKNESWREVCSRLRAQAPAPRVVLMSSAGGISPRAARAAGAAGFIAKDWSAREIARRVRMVGDGQEAFDEVQRNVDPVLTTREREVLSMIAGGATNREIAAALYLSPHTIKEHTSALYRKLGARNRAEAVQRAQSYGVPLDRRMLARADSEEPPEAAD